MYDAIVVGARCAGSPTAMLLARKGYRVLLVDKATFPSDIMSTHFVHQSGVARLKHWGLLEQVAASNCPPVRSLTFDFGPFALGGSPPPADGVAEAYAPRRKVLDKVLVDAAVAAGVELREGFSVQEILTSDDRVTGIRGRSGGGATVAEEARILVGADGLHSLVARTVRASTYNEKPALACYYYSYWSGVPVTGAEIFARPGQACIGFPTNDGLTVIGGGLTVDRFPEYRADIEDTFHRILAECSPEFSARVRAGRREQRWTGTADLPNFFRTPFGPGWALVGDAGYHKDPYTGEGISDAFRDAELLADALDDGFSGRRSLDGALTDYERRRNEAAMPIYELTCQLASMQPPPPEMQQLMGALAANRDQEDINRFLGLVAGTTSFQEFFAPENVARILGATTSAAAAS